MSLQIHTFELRCDHKNCNNKIVCSSADEMGKKGWSVFKRNNDYSDRSWIETDDPTFCPSHTPDESYLTEKLV